MRKKILKRIENKTSKLLIEWLRGIVSEEDAEKVTEKNYKSLLPKEEYISIKRTYYLALYTHRWAKQNIKKLLKKGIKLEDITIGDLIWIQKKTKKNDLSSIF
jgi:hypothetical protein|tara:strand:- start:323 stop:631 length:309 start_codon:yes stop_codon:yes gene_type:complete